MDNLEFESPQNVEQSPIERFAAHTALVVGPVIVLILLFLPLIHLTRPGETMPQWALFLGRFHPVILHFPIGWISVGVLLEACRLPRLRSWTPEVPLSLLRLVWSVAALSAVAAALLGWMLSFSGDYDPTLLKLHLTGGLLTAGSAVVVATLRLQTWRLPGLIFGPLVAVTLGVMTWAGHLGASITHGPDYLTEFAPAPFRILMGAGPKKAKENQGSTAAPVPNPGIEDDSQVYTNRILPVLNTSCVTCHGPTKSKGGLRLDSYEALLKGGTDGPVVVAHNPEKSELIRRIKLPMDDDEHMPPDGKKGLTEAQIALLVDWVKSSNFDIVTHGSAGKSDSGPQASSSAPVQEAAPAEKTPAELSADKAQCKLVENELKALPPFPGVLRMIVPEQPDVEFSVAYPFNNFDDNSLLKLSELKQNLKWLDLTHSHVTDAGMRSITAFTNLEKLSLSETGLTDSCLPAIGQLSRLEVLNLDQTRVTDEGMGQLKGLAALKRLYLWKTGVTDAGEAELKKALPNLEIVRELPRAVPPITTSAITGAKP